MKFEDLKIGDTFLLRSKDAMYPALFQMKVLKFSTESKAILFMETQNCGPEIKIWKSVDNLNSKYEIFDLVK